MMDRDDPEERQREIQQREERTAAEAQRMLENTRRFLDRLTDAPPESRRYVAGLKESLENEVRHLKSRRGEHPKPRNPQR